MASLGKKGSVWNQLCVCVYIAIAKTFHFSSDNPVVWNGTTLYFRGFRILDAVIDAVLAVAGENIEDVILTGCSGNIAIAIP